MRRAVWLAVALTVACGGGAGCGKDEGKPNPALKVPDIPPGGRDAKAKGPVANPPPRKK